MSVLSVVTVYLVDWILATFFQKMSVLHEKLLCDMTQTDSKGTIKNTYSFAKVVIFSFVQWPYITYIRVLGG